LPRPVSLVVTELALIESTEASLVLKEPAPGVPVAAILAATEATLLVPEHVPEMPLAE
jgi:acetate CoA/acetoacetate CoA-transferase beta subunit